jgi:predicted MFS family arabinose efflux permease
LAGWIGQSYALGVAEAEAAVGRVSAAERRPAGGLLRTRNFGLFWAGESISGFGSAITTVALPLVAVSTLRASTGQVALLTAANWLPWLLIGLPAGTWVDRWPRRRIMLAADLVSAAVLTAVPIAAWTGVLDVAMLLAAALVTGTSGMFFNLAFNGYLPHLLTAAGDRLEGNGKLQTSASVAQVAGPGLGGLITQVAGAVCGLLIDAVTFLVSAACLLSMRTGPEPRPARADRPSMVRQIIEGFAVFRQGGFLLPMLAVATMINCGMLSVWALRIVFLVRTDGAAPGTAGALISVSSLGGVLGAALASRTVRRFGSARTYLAANIATAPFMLLLPASGPGWRLALFAAGSFVVMGNATMSGVITVTFRGNYIPGHLLGRVTAATGFVVAGTVPLGAAGAGVLATAFGIRVAMWALAILFAVTPLPLLATSLRTMRDFPVRPRP